MLKIENIPDSIYLVALDYMGQNRPDNPAEARGLYEGAVSRADYQPITVTQMGADLGGLDAFALAIAQYLSLSGPFNEENGEFAGQSGYSLK